MANRFAQFVEPKSAEPVEPAAAVGIPQAPKANRFEQFVSKPAAAAGPKEDIVGQAGAGLVTGIPNMAAGFADMMEKGTVQGAIDVWEYPGKMVDALQGKTPKATVYKPVTGDLIRKGLSAAKINPNDYFAEPKTAGERMARMAGEGAITSVVPGGQQKGWAKLAEVAKNVFAGGVGGVGAQGAMELAPDEWDSVAGLAGGLAGGVGGYAAASAPGAAVRAAKGGVDYLRPAVATKGNVERLAAERVADAASDPVAAAAAMENAPELVPGSKPTAFQASGDVGLGTLERALSRGDDKFKAALIDRVEQQNAARVAALEGIEESGDVGAAVQFFRDRMRTLEEHADTLYDRAEKAAKGEYEGLGDRAAGDVGEAAREAIAARFKQMNGEASALWNSIDPDGTMNVTTEPLITETAKIYGRMSPEEKLSLSPDEKAIAGIIGSYGEILPFSNFKELRSEITRAMRKAKSFADPNDKAHRRLSMLRGAVEQAVEDSVAGKFAADASLADQFVKQAKEWYADRTRPEPQAEPTALAATGTDGAPSAVPSAEQGAPAAAIAPRSAGPQGIEPRPAESSPRLPEDAEPAVEPSAPISQRETFPVDEGTIQSLDPMEIGVDARRFQFKEGGDEAGVTDRLQGVEQWDPRLAGTALVFRDAQGKDWVADGHQRMGLARRLMENGHPPIRVNSFVLDAANGVTDAEARAIAAIKNVAEGTGTAVDAAKVMRAAKETGIDLPPLPPRSTLVRDGRALAELSPEAFGMVINEVVPSSQGAIVGRLVKDPLQQEEAVRLLATLKPDNVRQAEMVVRDMLSSGTERMTKQGGLFGEEAFAGSVTLERAKIADEALKQIKQDKRLYATLVNQAERIEGSGNVLAREANETRLTTDEKAADLLQKLAFRAGPVSDDLSRLARALKAGDQTANAAARDFLGSVRRAVEGGLDEGADAGGAGARAVEPEADPSVTPRDPDTAEMFQSAPPVQSPAFKRWFGDSKVVDAEGKPLVVHHGTRAEFDAFEPNKEGIHFGTGAQAQMRNGRRSVDAYLSIENPKRAKDTAGNWAKAVKAAKSSGHDGIVYLNRYEGIPFERFEELRARGISDAKMDAMSDAEFRRVVPEASDSYIAFEPTQVKSTANRGTFDPNSANILEQGKPAPWRPGEKLGMFDTEPGLEGLPQAVIPGVAPIDDATRMRSAAAKPLKGGDAAPPRGGLFDDDSREFADKQGSLFQSGEGAAIRDTMADRFAAAGRPPEEAVAAGTVVDAFYTTMAERLGKSVDELMAEHPLPQVQKGGGTGGFQQAPAENTPAFKRWFRKSKVTDGDGKPLAVYHGTNQPIDQFDIKRGGMATGENAGATKGFFFTDSRAVADQYATHAGERVVSNIAAFEREQARLQKEVARLERVAQRTGDWEPYEAAMAKWEDLEIGATREDASVGANVVETYLSLQNPMIVDLGGGRLTAARDMDTFVDQAKAKGHDGLIVKNVEDSPKMGIVSNHYVAFEPTQVKSTANSGAFDPADPRLLFQPAYHGSPHIFDKFEWSDKTRGKGEGAQAFGDGLYFAGRKEVAQYYRKGLAGETKVRLDGGDVPDYVPIGKDKTPDADRPMLAALGQVKVADGNIDKAIEALKESAARKEIGEVRAFYERAADWLENSRSRVSVEKPGRLYKVEIPDDADLMDWDTPLHRQSPAVQEKLASLGVVPRENSKWKPYPATDTDKPIIIDQFGSEIVDHGGYYSVFGMGTDNRAVHLGDPKSLAKAKDLVEQQYAYDRSATGERIYKQLQAKLGSKKAASDALREAGLPGHRFLDQGSRFSRDAKALVDKYGSPEKALEIAKQRAEDASLPIHRREWESVVAELERGQSHNYVIYDDKRVNVTEYEQNKEGPRGSIQFGDTGSLIKMFESADASTAVHESAHHFLKMFRSMAEGADVPDAIAKDWRATKAWWDNNAKAVADDAGEGVTPSEVRKALRGESTGDRAKDRAIDKGFHEQWARGFEQYLRDGRAPNKALRGIFDQFKNWLTSVYQSAMQLNVKLSPEIRKVFDQMLASDESRAGMPKMLDEAGAKRFSDATAATREIKDVFGAKPVKQMLRRPGPTYPYEMTAEGVANNLFKAGPEGAAAIKAAVRAGAPKETIEAAAVASLKRAASKDGTIDPTKLAAWRQKHADALREVPELERRMGSAAKATEAMVDIAARRKEAVDQVQRSAVGRLLKVEDDADVSAVLGRMLGRDTAVKDMRSLVTEARGDPSAMAGLRRAVVDHMVSRLKTPKDALRSDTFQRYLGKNAPALSQVLTPEQMGSLRAIALDMKRASKDVRSPGGGSDTAENIAAMKRAGVNGDQPSIMGQVIRRALASGALGWLAHALQGPVIGAASGVASFLGGTVLQALRARGISKVDDLVREAILDPELMRRLLAKAPKRKEAGSADALRRWLGQNVFNDLAVNIGDEEKEWRGTPQRPRPSDEGKFAPTLGVRG